MTKSRVIRGVPGGTITSIGLQRSPVVWSEEDKRLFGKMGGFEMTESKQFRHENDDETLIVFDHDKGAIYLGVMFGQAEFFLERSSAINLASHLLQWATQQPQEEE